MTDDWCTPQDIADANTNVHDVLRTLAARVDKLERELAQLRSEMRHMLPAGGVRVVER